MTRYINNWNKTMPVFKITNKEETTTNTDKELNKETTVMDEEIEDRDKIVVVEGSLSKVFTEALNKAYAVESIDAMINETSEDEDKKEEDKDNKEKAYVYVTDGNDMGIDEANNIIKHMRIALDEKYDKVVLSVENVNRVTDSLGLLDSYCSESNIEIVYNVEKAISKL